MLKVIKVVDKIDTALDRLAKGEIPYHQNLDYTVCDVHPKRPDPSQLDRFFQEAKTADVIDYQYFRTAEMLRKNYPWLKDIPSILTHNNPYSITEGNWNDYQIVVTNNKTILGDLQKITEARTELIPIVVDPYFWKFNDDYQYPRSVIMVANRIESKKGILPVAKACKLIGCKMYLVGNISDMEYFKEIMATEAVEFAQNITDEQLRELYHKSGIHVCNSVDNFESGTMPILESIFCGVPVLTRMVGHVPDFYANECVKIQDSTSDDVEHIAELLEEMFADRKELDRKRHEAWNCIKDRNYERRAFTYQRLYRDLMGGELVSVIMPVSGKLEITKQSINAVFNQTHRNIELIIADDGAEPQGDTIQELAQTSNIPLRYIRVDQPGYNLAKARNLGAIEATSDILVFCDQRMMMDNNAVEEFVKNIKSHHWLYGSKGAKKDFIENFSCILKEDFAKLGMFNERITKYGGMSQECRSRARRQGFNTLYIETAKATPLGKSSNRWSKKIDIMEMKNILWKVGLQ